ncbi:MAG: hypothetical protein EZS28_007665 [Streblomastix strix]|uniref:Uncharacterized protein n=1 Tax=Streblomastix strix TaxID=222440 RepID=A0A5J4WQ24_9EUKA|nr:MAG: hypothetical protein EZS28_007665 [Streblomastix strix]
MIDARTGIRSMRQPFSKNVKEFNKTGTVRAGTVCELRPTKVHCKDTRRDRSQETGDVRQDWEAVSERTQRLMAKVLEAITSVKASEIDLWATNILDEQNGEARRKKIQCPSLLHITSVPVPDEVLDLKRRPIDKILQSKQALALFNFKISEGIPAHLCEQQEENTVIDILSWMIHNLRQAERTYFARSGNENGTNANNLILAANSINSHLNSEAGSHMWEAQVIARRDTENKDTIEITNLLNLGTNNESNGPRGQPPPEKGSYKPRSEVIPYTAIFPPILITKQEIPEIQNVMTKETINDHIYRWILKGFDLIPVVKDIEGQYRPGFGLDVPHVANWRKSQQQGIAPSMEEVKAFWREYNFDLKIENLRKKFDSEDDSETLQPARTTRQGFRYKFGKRRYLSLSRRNG